MQGPGTTYDKETSNVDWYGPGTTYTLDSTQPFTSVTQFYDSPTDGSLTNITRYYLQKGKRIDLPTLYVVKPKGGQSITKSIAEASPVTLFQQRDSGGKLPLHYAVVPTSAARRTWLAAHVRGRFRFPETEDPDKEADGLA